MIREKVETWSLLIEQRHQDATYTNLLEKIESREAVLAVIGLGYVGLPLATAFAKAGFHVVGIDVNPSKVAAINGGWSYIRDVPSETLARYTLPAERSTSEVQRSNAGTLTATTDYDAIYEADVAIICVPTPLGKAGDPDCSYLIAAADEIARRLHRGMLVILESTSYPGSTEELILPRLQSANGQTFQVGTDFFLAFSPERIDPGNDRWTVENIPKLVGGLTPACTQVTEVLLRQINPQIHPVSSPRVAEMAKLLENIFRSVNIALVNELALLAERMGLDIWEVIEAAATKPFGFMPFYPGPGVGGHCIAVDPYYLSWKAQEFDFSARFIELAAETNQRMPYHVVELISGALAQRGKGLRGAKVLLLGVAFKPEVDDVRNTPAKRVTELLLDLGAEVNYHDPYVPRFEVQPNVSDNRGRQMFESIPLDDDVLTAQDCVVVLVHHRCLDYGRVVRLASLVVDAVNGTGRIDGTEKKVVRLGAGVLEHAAKAEIPVRQKLSAFQLEEEIDSP